MSLKAQDVYGILNSKIEEGSGSSGGGNSELVQIDHGTSNTTFTLPPNQLHTWGQVTELNISLGSATSGKINEYMFFFDSGTTATALTLPETVVSDLVVEANQHYEVSIINNYLAWMSWAVT